MKKEEVRTRGGPGDDRCNFLIMLDNVLTVGVSAGGEEQSGRHHSHPGGGGCLEGAEGGYKNGAAADFANVLRRK